MIIDDALATTKAANLRNTASDPSASSVRSIVHAPCSIATLLTMTFSIGRLHSSPASRTTISLTGVIILLTLRGS